MRNRRLEIRNQHIVLGSIVVVLVLVIISSVLFGTIKAQAASAETSYKYYTSIQVQRGDTLWNIAGAYITDDYENIDEYIDEICSINHISDENIHAGQYITIPYYSNDYLK